MKQYIFGFLFMGFVVLMSFYSYDNPLSEREIVTEDAKFIVPLKVHIVQDDSGFYSSSRNEENIKNLFVEVNRIWKQADVGFVIQGVVVTRVSGDAIPSSINTNSGELYNHENFDKDRINVFFTQSLNGINGLALFNINSVLVADFTTVNDYRTTAHELGHILGLRHVQPNDMLMARGRNGELLSEDEIVIVRVNVGRYI